jgi:ribonuclease HI
MQAVLSEEWVQKAAAEAAADVLRRATEYLAGEQRIGRAVAAAAADQARQDVAAAAADTGVGAATRWFGPDGVKLRTAAWQARGYDSPAIRNEIVWQFHTEPAPRSVPNHTSVREHQQQMGAHFDAMLADGITEQYDSSVHGTISAFAAVVNPLHVVPKGDGIRPIIDPTASGVNACMQQLPCRLPDLATLLQHLPQGGYLGKRDLASGFHHCVLAPAARRYMAFRHPVSGALQRYVALPFGASQSPAIFCELTAAATDIIRAECSSRGLQVRIFTYCDDFMIIGQQHADVVGAFEVMDAVGAELGLAWKAEKDQGRETACQQLEFLGMLFDTVKLEMRITPDKRQRYAAALRSLLDRAAAARNVVPRQDLQSVAGKLTFVARACRWGYTFLQSVYDALFTTRQPAPRDVTLEPAALEDLRWWSKVLHTASAWDGTRPCTNAALELVRGEFANAEGGAVVFTDASGVGFGAHWGPAEMQGFFTRQQQQSHIAWLELTAIVRALQTWAPKLRGRKVLVRCDNTQAVAAVNHGSTRVREGRSLCRQLAELAISAGFELRAEHIAGVENVRADRLSRQLAQARDQNLRLKPAIFRSLVGGSGGRYRPTVDCCADALGINAQPGCTEFYSPERSVVGQQQQLAGKVLWAFPPFALIGEVLATIAAAARLSSATRATVVVPDVGPEYGWYQRWVRGPVGQGSVFKVDNTEELRAGRELCLWPWGAPADPAPYDLLVLRVH